MKKKITALLAGIFALGITAYAQIPTVTFTGTPNPVCAGSSVTFTNTPNNAPTTWTWYFPGANGPEKYVLGAPGNPPPITYSIPGTYNVICVVRNGLPSNPLDSTTNVNYIVVEPLPKATIIPQSGGLCSVQDTIQFSEIDTTVGNTYTWLPSATNISCATCENPKAYPTVAQTVYTVTVTGADGCTLILTDTVIAGGNPIQARIWGKDTICAGTPDTLYASGGSSQTYGGPPSGSSGTTYTWSNGKTTSSIIVAPNASTPYTCFITTDGGACSATAIFPVTVFPVPHFTIESPDSICYPNSATITISPPTGGGGGFGNQYFWYGPPNGVKDTDIFTVSPAVTTTYTLAIKNGCVFDSLVKVKVNTPPIVYFTGATNLCQYSTTTICAHGGNQYVWSTGQTTSCINVTGIVSLTYTVQVRSGECFKDTTFTIIVDTMPVVKFKGDTSICSGDSTTISVVPGYEYSYLWNTGSTLDSIVVGSLIGGGAATIPGKYTYFLTVTKGACSKDSEQITVKVYPHPKPVVYPIDTTVCEYDPVTLTATGGDYYTWTPKNSGLNHYFDYADTDRNVATPTITTVYAVKVCTWGCCKDTSPITVNIVPNVQGASVCCTDTVGAGTPVNLSATYNPGPYFVDGWSPSTGLSCNNCPNPTATVNTTTTYVVTFADDNGCTVKDSVTIYVLNCNVFVPNVFSPNGDGINDRLFVRSLCMRSMSFAVFDRFGNKIFETADQDNGWDGTFHGKKMEVGTYMWYLTGLLNDGTHITKSGNVTLVR